MTAKNRNPYKNQSWILRNLGVIIASLSALSLIAAFLIFFKGVPLLVEFMMSRELRLVPGSDTFGKWVNISVPILIKFYIFNITNADSVIQDKFQFHVEEVGPYVWEEKRSKIIVDMNEEEDSITYREVITFHFRPDLTNGSLDDVVNFVNVPFYSAATLIYKKLFGVPTLANFVINQFFEEENSYVLRNIRVGDLVFDGVELPPIYGILADFEIVDLPPEFIGGAFAFYNGKNGTPAKPHKISRGIKKPETFGKILTYNGDTEVNIWTNNSYRFYEEQYCNKINGSDGSMFSPFLKKNERLYLFKHEICRSAYITYDSEVNYHGIPAWRYIFPDQIMEDPRINPENQCFCVDPGYDLSNNCGVSGIMRLFPCKQEVPLLLSKPHFMDVSPSVFDGVKGLNANRTLHEMEAILEPTSGAVLKALVRLQISLEFQPLPNISAFENVKAAAVPIFWVQEQAILDEKDLSEIQTRLIIPLQVVEIVQWTIIGLLSLFIPVGILMTCRKNEQVKVNPLKRESF